MKTEVEAVVKVEVVPGLTVGSLRRFSAFDYLTQGLSKRRRLHRQGSLRYCVADVIMPLCAIVRCKKLRSEGGGHPMHPPPSRLGFYQTLPSEFPSLCCMCYRFPAPLCAMSIPFVHSITSYPILLEYIFSLSFCPVSRFCSLHSCLSFSIYISCPLPPKPGFGV